MGAQVPKPEDEHDEHERDGKANDDDDESIDLPLQICRLFFSSVGKLVDATHDRLGAREDDDGVGREETFDAVHHLGGGEVLQGVEDGLQEDDDHDEDS